MRLYRKWAFLGTFGLAAVLTPPDIITQCLLAVPLYALYEFGVVVSTFFEDPKVRAKVYQDMEDQARARQAATQAKAANEEDSSDNKTTRRVVRKVVRKVKKE
jgi:sec-independent protein translocase protein TatC